MGPHIRRPFARRASRAEQKVLVVERHAKPAVFVEHRIGRQDHVHFARPQALDQGLRKPRLRLEPAYALHEARNEPGLNGGRDRFTKPEPHGSRRKGRARGSREQTVRRLVKLSRLVGSLWPAGVSLRGLACFTNNEVPACSSSFATAWETADGEMPRRLAAALAERSSAAVMKARRKSRLGIGVMWGQLSRKMNGIFEAQIKQNCV